MVNQEIPRVMVKGNPKKHRPREQPAQIIAGRMMTPGGIFSNKKVKWKRPFNLLDREESYHSSFGEFGEELVH